MTPKIKLSANFVEEIEKIVGEGLSSHMDAVVLYCERNNIEIETAAAIIRNNRKLKAKIKSDAQILKMVK